MDPHSHDAVPREVQQEESLPRVRFSVRQLLTVSTLTCIALGAGAATLFLILAGSILPGILLVAALGVPQLILFLVLRRWLPKVKRDPLEDE